jgi:CheY-like chemotaxis protein
MDGEITMQSAPGRGTTMRLTVPLPIGEPAEIEPLAAPMVESGGASRPKPTREQALREESLLLIVEDHAVNRTVLRRQLDIIGLDADFATDGNQAFEQYLSGQYALVLTDLSMPGMNGYELAHAIRRHEAEAEGARIPILAQTANVMEGEPERCRQAGMDDFVAKPTTISFLGTKLRQWLPHLDWSHGAEPARADGSGAVADAAVDVGVLAEVTGGDAELAASLVDDFVESTRLDLQALDEALAVADLDEARRRAHRIKGAARTVGAHTMVELAQQIESEAASGCAAPQLMPLAARLSDAFADCESAMVSMR